MQQTLDIVYEDEHLIAINKPAGLLVHAVENHQAPTVAMLLEEYCPQVVGVGEEPIETTHGNKITRWGIVHRLDRDTSGIMLLVKTPEGHAHLKKQFQDREISKSYRALVYGALKQERYLVEAPIGRSKNFGRWTSIPKSLRGEARRASTEIIVVEQFSNNFGTYSLIEARPITGRTHQIRVHLQYINYPIVADPLYAGKRTSTQNNLGIARQALHAHSINFTNLEAKDITVQAPLAEDFSSVLQKLQEL